MDTRIRLVEDVPQRCGAAQSFFVLMERALATDAKFIALCDQDDLWEPDKLHCLLGVLEDARAADRPLVRLVFSDLRWIGIEDETIAESHFRATGIEPQQLIDSPASLLAMNAIPGCAMLFTRSVAELALPWSPRIAHHDWWLILVAVTHGDLRFVRAPLTRYRQHQKNQIGARTRRQAMLTLLSHPQRLFDVAWTTYWQGVDMASELQRRSVAGICSKEWAARLHHAVNGLGADSRWHRINSVLRGPVRRVGLPRLFLQCIAALRDKPSR